MLMPTNRTSEDPANALWRIRRARRDDLKVVLEILSEGARRMAEEGEGHPWPEVFPAEEVRPFLEQGAVHLAEDGHGVAVGTFMLLWTDPTYWPTQPEPAGHLHRMAVRRSAARRGAGRAMAEVAVELTRAHGWTRLRLECLTSAVRLRAFYERLGYRPLGRVEARGFDLTLYELPVP